MIIDEKGLCRAMKRAWKGGGYTVMDDGEVTRIWCDRWFLQAERGKLPVKALALMVEHMGALPGAPTTLQKDSEAQLVLEDVAAGEVSGWMQGRVVAPVSRVPVTFCGAQVLQAEGIGPCWGVTPGCFEIIERVYRTEMSARATEGNKVVWQEEGELVTMMAVRPSEDFAAQPWQSTVWKAMEGVDLHRKE